MIDTTLAELTLNITDGKHGDCRDSEGSGYYFISCKDVKDGRINYDNARQIMPEDFAEAHKRTQLEPDDILITNSGTIGRMAYIVNTPLTHRTTFQKSVAIVKPNKTAVHPKYLYYQLHNCVQDFVNQSNGSAQKNLLLSTMRAFKMHIHHDKQTQERIAEILTAYDDLIENNQKQIKLLEEAAQRLYKEWFVDLRFPGYEKTPIVDGVPEGWRVEELGNIAVLKAGGDRPKVFSKERTTECSVPVFSNGTENEGLYGFTNNAEVTEDCVTISARGSVGYTCLRKTAFVPIVRLIAVIPNQVDVEYLFYFLKNMVFESNGAAQQQITVPMIKGKQIIIPSNSVMDLFIKQIRPMMEYREVLKCKISTLVEARDRLLPKLMNGEIEV